MITFTHSVGTAPGTTTLIERPPSRELGVMQCGPWPVPISVSADQNKNPIDGRFCPGSVTPIHPKPHRAEKKHHRFYNPYPTVADLKGSGGLGFVLVNGGGWEINRTLPNEAGSLVPYDPQYYRRGETGYYYDTPLGAIPTDAELGPNECYTPVQSAWIDTGEGYVAPPYVPPNGWRPVPAQYGPPTSLGEAVDATVVKHEKRMFYLTAISTIAIVAAASASVYQVYRNRK